MILCHFLRILFTLDPFVHVNNKQDGTSDLDPGECASASSYDTRGREVQLGADATGVPAGTQHSRPGIIPTSQRRSGASQHMTKTSIILICVYILF